MTVVALLNKEQEQKSRSWKGNRWSRYVDTAGLRLPFDLSLHLVPLLTDIVVFHLHGERDVQERIGLRGEDGRGWREENRHHGVV